MMILIILLRRVVPLELKGILLSHEKGSEEDGGGEDGNGSVGPG